MKHESFAQIASDAELVTPLATTRIARLTLTIPADTVFRRDDVYYLDMCLTPRPEGTRGCYGEHWGPHRFERLGEIILVPPGEAIHIRCDEGGRQASIMCELDAAAVDRWIGAGIAWTGPRLLALLDIANPYIRYGLYRLAEEARDPGPESGALAEAVVSQLAIEIARICRAVADGPATGGLATWRLRIIDARLQQPGPMPSLEELASLCNCSARQLTRGFRASRGCSIGDHMAQTRIENTKRRLAAGESIKSIAFALGYASASSLTCAFRRATGYTPRQFRKRHYPGGLMAG